MGGLLIMGAARMRKMEGMGWIFFFFFFDS